MTQNDSDQPLFLESPWTFKANYAQQNLQLARFSSRIHRPLSSPPLLFFLPVLTGLLVRSTLPLPQLAFFCNSSLPLFCASISRTKQPTTFKASKIIYHNSSSFSQVSDISTNIPSSVQNTTSTQYLNQPLYSSKSPKDLNA